MSGQIDPGYRRLGPVRPFPVGPSTFADIWARRDPDSVAVVEGSREWTTRELQAECERVARCLVGRGITAGDRVAWILGDDGASIVSLLATARAGAIWVGVSSRSTDAERRAIVEDARPRLVLDALPTEDPELTLDAPPGPADVVALAYTSGTTGRPKGALHIQQQLLYPAAAAIATEGLNETSRIGTPLPLATLNILLLGPLTALACGGTAVLMAGPGPERVAADIERHGITRVLVVPAIVHDLVAAGVEPVRLASLDRMIMGGAGIDRERAAAAQTSLEVPLVASYGLSEAPTGVARMAIGEPAATALPGIDVRVEPDGEITLAPMTTGPWAQTWQGTLGYHDRPSETERLWRGGRLHTGDAGALDAGRLLVTGRVSDMINRGGATIAPAEVEAVLLSLEAVEDAAVFAVEDDRLGQIVAAAVVGPADASTLAPAVREHLSGYKVPERWVSVDRLPRNANGKVDRAALRAALG